MNALDTHNGWISICRQCALWHREIDNCSRYDRCGRVYKRRVWFHLVEQNALPILQSKPENQRIYSISIEMESINLSLPATSSSPSHAVRVSTIVNVSLPLINVQEQLAFITPFATFVEYPSNRTITLFSVVIPLLIENHLFCFTNKSHSRNVNAQPNLKKNKTNSMSKFFLFICEW